MEAAERAAIAGALARTNKGPKDAIIRTVQEADMDRAFADEGGSIPHAERLKPTSRGAGNRGSLAGIKVGSPDAQGGADKRTEEIARQRAARAAGKPAGQTTAPVQPRPTAPVQELPSASPAPTLEPWELEAEASPEPVAETDMESDSSGDVLAYAYKGALSILASLPDGVELYLGKKLGYDSVQLVMGIGLLVGKGFVMYRGNNHYAITALGRKAATENNHE